MHPVLHRLKQALPGGNKAEGKYPAGHYYSPIPSPEEIESHYSKAPSDSILGVDLNKNGQRKLLEQFAELYDALPFSTHASGDSRYHYENGWFSYSDAIFYSCFLQSFRPRSVVEIGSGFSSAVLLDTVDSFFDVPPKITFVEPYPDRLKSLLKGADEENHLILNQKVQDVPIELFCDLKANDLLFVDSSHVIKCGSDLEVIMFEILPQLKPGVFVHFHDVFFPFDYPKEWIGDGLYWNENYLLRAFLSYNSQWQIRFFNTYVHHAFGDFIAEKMPLTMKNLGGSLYLERL